jgi:hypothetical protein
MQQRPCVVLINAFGVGVNPCAHSARPGLRPIERRLCGIIFSQQYLAAGTNSLVHGISHENLCPILRDELCVVLKIADEV